jgi:transposase
MAVPAVPSSLLEPIWAEFTALLPERGEFHPDHPLGCHRRRIPDRVVFEHIVQALVHGSGYERIASSACSDATIRRRLKQWAAAGIAEQVHAVALAAYHRVIGLLLADIGADGCITKAPCGGQHARPSPVDRGKQGRKRSVVTEARGILLGAVHAGANTHDSPLLAPTLDTLERLGPLPTRPTVHLDRCYDSGKTRRLLTERGMTGQIAERGQPAPVQASRRWPVERTNAWGNQFKKLAWTPNAVTWSSTPSWRSPTRSSRCAA